jgi:drug/metabolite transporter (DMT)-like permease
LALAAAWWLGDPLTLRKGLGLSHGVVGVAIVVGWAPLPLTGPALLGVTLMLLATLCYGQGGVYIRKAFADVAPLELTVGVARNYFGSSTSSTLTLKPARSFDVARSPR